MLLKFKNEDGVDRKGEKKYMESDPDGDEMEEAGINEKGVINGGCFFSRRS